ncbi:MAG: pyridoxal-phosphate dependent enzyme, partial [Woeseiaceae bacterium]|nr:pyridoxal-phosphate dependent enzyme [Woeseiaceae bacterium]
MANTIEKKYPGVAKNIPRIALCERPTPVDVNEIVVDGARIAVAIKRDDLTSPVYGGNKVRKLEYLLRRARDLGASRVATFGAVASNHATATSIFSQREGFSCTCFLSHQTRTPAAGRALNMHNRLGTEIVEFGGSRRERIATIRRTLRGQKASIVPLGGTCPLG